MTGRLNLTFCFALLFCCSGTTAQEPVRTKRTIPVGSNPESVCRGFDGKLYVTLINGEEPGDGAVAVVDDDDRVAVFAKGLNSPKGIVYVDGHLVVADETTLWKIDRHGKVSTLADKASFPEPIEFLNDVAADKNGGSVFVAEMSTPTPMFDPSGERRLWSLESAEAGKLPKKGRVYQVTMDGRVTAAFPSGDEALRFPNGLTVGGTKEKQRLFAADFFTGNIVTYEEGKYRRMAKGPRGLDGLAVTKDHFFASSWTEGVVWKIDRKSKEHTVLLDGMKTAADFLYDNRNQQLIVPDMVAGTLTFLPLQ